MSSVFVVEQHVHPQNGLAPQVDQEVYESMSVIEVEQRIHSQNGIRS